MLIHTAFNCLVVIWRYSIVFFRAVGTLAFSKTPVLRVGSLYEGKSDSVTFFVTSHPPWFPYGKTINHWPVIIFRSLALAQIWLREGLKLVQWEDWSRYLNACILSHSAIVILALQIVLSKALTLQALRASVTQNQILTILKCMTSA